MKFFSLIFALFAGAGNLFAQPSEAIRLMGTEVYNISVSEYDERTEILTLGFNHMSGSTCHYFVGFEEMDPNQFFAYARTNSAGQGCASRSEEESLTFTISMSFANGPVHLSINRDQYRVEKKGSDVVITKL
ncbi:MAG: hypothetical protein AB7T49_14705 [Oligoflexales bacterium]